LISIIIPTFNRASLIDVTLNSIINQSYTDWECIVVDDGSTDKTAEVLNAYILKDSRIKYYSRPKYIKKGATACRNFGYKLSKGDYICWFDSDDIMPINSLYDRIYVLENNKCDFVIGRLMNFYDDPNIIFDEKKSVLYPITNNPAADYIIRNFWFQTSVPLFKKTFLKKFTILFDEKLTFHDEGEFFVRVLLKNPIINSVDTVVTIRRMHLNSLRVGVNSLGKKEKILFDQFSYFIIWKNFTKNRKYYDNTVKDYFKYYFQFWITKMKFDKSRLLFIYFYGIIYGMFNNNIHISKILLWRLLKKR
jgi:glycosyltransferase involved in cell wall biosynthesis